MTVSKVRSRQRHKVENEEDIEESTPSTSSSSTSEESEDVTDSGRRSRISRIIDTEISVDGDEDDSTRMRHRRRYAKFMKTRRRLDIYEDTPSTPTSTTVSGSSPLLNSTRKMLIILSLFALFQSTSSITELRCGPVDIRNKPGHFRQQWSRLGDPKAVALTNKSVVDCTIIEGSFSISFVYHPQDKSKPRVKQSDYPTFPYLREITGSLLIFETQGLFDLSKVFPVLSVIGGQALVQHYSLIIYRNLDLHTIGLNHLSVVRTGGIRIQDNKFMCHGRTIDWKSMILSTVNDVVIDNAAEMAVSETGMLCPKQPCEEDKDGKKCRYLDSASYGRVQSCWSNTTCQKFCKYELRNGVASGPGCDPHGNKCHEQCIGGCDKVNDASACNACRNVHYNGKCVPKCPANLYTLMNRRCVTREECLSYNPVHANISVPIKATAGFCSDHCPPGYEINPTNVHECQKCDGECIITCPIDHIIDTYGKATALKRCHIIDGNLSIEIRGREETGMAKELKGLFGNIRTITGYLKIERSPPFISLGMFKKLERVEAKSLYRNEFAITVVDNHGLRRLFDEDLNITIGRGTIQIVNNRMLCPKHVTSLMKKLKVKIDYEAQGIASNGEKAICEDLELFVNVTDVGPEWIDFEWTSFNTTNMDQRKFLGYELFFKSVPAIDPKMSIDDDRSACVDSWHSQFYTHVDRDDGRILPTVSHKLYGGGRLRPNTIYAYYVATQMVHHEGAKNGLSKIGFIRTKFSTPDPPTLTVAKADTDSILIGWDPPHLPNGDITHYFVQWSEVDLNVPELAERFCNGDTKNTDDALEQYDSSYDELIPSEFEKPVTTKPPVEAGEEGTCSAIAGCCECGAESSSSEPLKSHMTNDAAIAARLDDTQFENEVMDFAIKQRCDFDKDPLKCAMSSRPPEQEILEDEDPEDVDSGARYKRNSEAWDRQRRQLYLGDVHGIRSTDRRQYEQFQAILIDSIRARRSIENLNRVNEMYEKQEKEQKEQEAKKAPKKPLTHVSSKTKPPTSTVPSIALNLLTTGHPYGRLYEGGWRMNEIRVVSPPGEKRTLWGVNVTSRPTGNTFIIPNLKHFTYYGISILACQDPDQIESTCSHYYKAGMKKRTLPLDNIDVVNSTTIRAAPGNATGTIILRWDDVTESNGGVRGYEVRMINSETRLTTAKCLGATRRWSANGTGVQFQGLPGGSYIVQIVTSSMKGTGPEVNFHELVYVFVPGFFTLEKIGLIILFLIILAILVSSIVYYYVQVHYGKKVKALADFMHLNPEYAIDNRYTADDWEIDPSWIVKGDQCGEGSFGKVFLGMGNNIKSMYGCEFGPCAIKINHGDNTPTAQENNLNYLMEAQVMKNFKSHFIVKLYGVISTQDPAWVIMEMMELGNLRDFLRAKREDEVFDEMEYNFYDIVPKEKFQEWAAQISDGMAYLESLKFCHRDLAARNCMINSSETVKIGDFGMARDLFYHDYYKPSGKRMMPVRWMSPESLKDGKFDSKSDVWAFGVVLYEMLTLGAQPYVGLSNDEVLNYIGVARKVIKKPECCSVYWYKIMKMCWRYSPRDRPTFLQLVHLLSAEASPAFKEKSFVLTENRMAMEDSEPLDLDEVDIFQDETTPRPAGAAPGSEVTTPGDDDPSKPKNSESIPMKEFKSSPSDLSASTSSTAPRPQQRGGDDEYALMNHSQAPSDAEVVAPSTYNGGDGDYVERDVTNDVPTRRNTGVSNNSFNGGPFCLSNRAGSNERAGFGEAVRFNDPSGDHHHHHHHDDPRDHLIDPVVRKTSYQQHAHTNQPTNWSGSKGVTYYANKEKAEREAAAAAALEARKKAQQDYLEGRNTDWITQLPGTGIFPPLKSGRDQDYIETMPRNGNGRNGGSPARNGNMGRLFDTRFEENERLIEDPENPSS